MPQIVRNGALNPFYDPDEHEKRDDDWREVWEKFFKGRCISFKTDTAFMFMAAIVCAVLLVMVVFGSRGMSFRRTTRLGV